ncbi:MAG: hypothetical protein ACRDJN_17555, partial [Chloroflexota bacterium]
MAVIESNLSTSHAVAAPVGRRGGPRGDTTDGSLGAHRSRGRIAGLILRPLVSLALLAALFWKFGAGEVWQTLTGADP